MDLERMRVALSLPPDATAQDILTEMAKAGGRLLGPTGLPLPQTPEVVNTHTVQAQVEGATVDGDDVVGGGQRIDFMGESFRMAQSIGLMPLIRFAHSAKKGMSSDDMEGLAAMYAMIRDCIDPADFPRFEEHATVMKAEADELFELVGNVIEVLAARPTKRPGGSSAGPETTSENSKATPSSQGTVPQHQLDGMVAVDTLMGRSTG